MRFFSRTVAPKPRSAVFAEVQDGDRAKMEWLVDRIKNRFVNQFGVSPEILDKLTFVSAALPEHAFAEYKNGIITINEKAVEGITASNDIELNVWVGIFHECVHAVRDADGLLNKSNHSSEEIVASFVSALSDGFVAGPLISDMRELISEENTPSDQAYLIGYEAASDANRLNFYRGIAIAGEMLRSNKVEDIKECIRKAVTEEGKSHVCNTKPYLFRRLRTATEGSFA